MEKAEIKNIDRYRKVLDLLTQVVEAGDQLIGTPVESAAYPALKRIYDNARAALMRFQHEND